MKFVRLFSLFLIVAVLAACAPAAASETPAATEAPTTETGYPAPAVEPTAAAAYPAPSAPVETATEAGYPAPDAADNLPAACKVDGMTTFTDANGRFCFAYPADFSAEGEGLVGPTQDPDAARARLVIESEALQSGMDLAGVIAARLAEYGDAAVQQADAQLGGEPAISLEPVPGDPGSLDYVMVHGGEVISLHFQPNGTTYPQGQPDRDALVDIVVKSFTFLK